VLRALLSRGWIGNRCWNGNRRGVLSGCQGSFRKEEYRSMRIHLDRKQLDGLDGNLIALVVLSLIIIIAFAY
jgi:hypothetical protein